MGLIALLWSLLAAWYTPTVADLGDERFEVRDAADADLAAAGVWAYPAVVGGCRSASPEVASRCERLAVRPVAIVRDAEAVAILCGLIEPDYPALAGDAVKLGRLYRTAKLLGCPDRVGEEWDVGPESRVAEWFLPNAADFLIGFFFQWDETHPAREGVVRCRDDIRFRFMPATDHTQEYRP